MLVRSMDVASQLPTPDPKPLGREQIRSDDQDRFPGRLWNNQTVNCEPKIKKRQQIIENKIMKPTSLNS